MDWTRRLLRALRCKFVHGTHFPKANLPSTLLNIAARGFQPKHIVDVGAHKSRWSLDARLAFPDATFTLIEPQIELERYLRSFCAKQPGSRYLIAGAGAEKGELLFTVCPTISASNFVTTAEDGTRRGFKQRVVPVVTVDDIIRSEGRVPDILKIDAEGFEQKVIEGASLAVGKTELVFLEAHFQGHPGDPSDFATLVSFMADRDYVPYDFTWFGRHGTDGSLFLCEIAFALRNGYLRARKAQLQREVERRIEQQATRRRAA